MAYWNYGGTLACGCVRTISKAEYDAKEAACIGRYANDKHKRMQPLVDRGGSPAKAHRCDQPLHVEVEPSTPSIATDAPTLETEPAADTQTSPVLLPVAGQLTFGDLLGA